MHLSIVIKVSKFCNLRCAYCYETPWLSDQKRMSIDEIRTIFRKIVAILSHAPKAARRVTFHWQGGEPFVQPIAYWRAILAAQVEEFDGSGAFLRNEIQSNGTLIRPDHLPLLRAHFHLGMSFDVINDMRLTTGAETTHRRVIEVLDWLLGERVQITGCIAVISKRNIDQPLDVANFFLSRRLHFRLLNIYTGMDSLVQIREQAVEWASYLKFCEAILAYEEARRALWEGASIEPVTTALAMLRRHNSGELEEACDDAEREWVLVIDTNGDLYSAGDLYDKEFCYGNIFHDKVPVLLQSEGRLRRIARGRHRVASICKRCFLYGHGCDGLYVAHCTPEEARAFEELGTCYYGWLASAAERMNFDSLGGPCMSASS